MLTSGCVTWDWVDFFSPFLFFLLGEDFLVDSLVVLDFSNFKAIVNAFSCLHQVQKRCIGLIDQLTIICWKHYPHEDCHISFSIIGGWIWDAILCHLCAYSWKFSLGFLLILCSCSLLGAISELNLCLSIKMSKITPSLNFENSIFVNHVKAAHLRLQGKVWTINLSLSLCCAMVTP